MRTRLFAVAATVLVAGPAAAQEQGRAAAQAPGPAAAQGQAAVRAEAPDYDFEVFGNLGWGRRGGDEGSHGGGPMLSGGVGFRPFRRIGFEAEAGVLKHARSFPNPVKFEGTVASLSANVLYHFSESRTQWYVLGGLGWIREEQAVIFKGMFPVDDSVTRSTNRFAVWSAGVGFKRFVTPRLLLRPEFRYSTGGPLGVLGILRLTIGLGYVW